MIRDDILPFAVSMPKDFVKRVMQLLNRGSIHATSSDSFIGSAFSTIEKKAPMCFIHRPDPFLGSKSLSALSKTLMCFINGADTFIRSKSFCALEPKPQVCYIHRANTFMCSKSFSTAESNDQGHIVLSVCLSVVNFNLCYNF